MKVIVFGKSGQLASELVRNAPEGVSVTCFGRAECDVTDFERVRKCASSIVPQVIINASAYTAVDKAETDSEQAFLVNHLAVANLAKVSKEIGAKLIHVSTDFVFGEGFNRPVEVSSHTSPLNVYGQSKLMGEQAIESSGLPDYSIVRTSWVYSGFGGNFVKTMLRLMNEKSSLSIVSDQIGTPTNAKGLAEFLWCVAKIEKAEKIYHWSDLGIASWYDFAVSIQSLALDFGLLDKKIPLKAISSDDYPLPANRPHFSALDTSRSQQVLEGQHWREALKEFLGSLV